MEQSLFVSMEKPTKILRRSIHKFLQNYHYFAFTAAFLVLPFSVAVLLSQALVPSVSPILPTVASRLRTLFEAAGFPPSSQFFTILHIKASQTICSYIFTLPFTLSFLLFAKAAIIQSLRHDKTTLSPSLASFLPLYCPLLCTHLCNSFIILSANASAFSVLFLAFNSFDSFGFSSANFILFLSAAGAVLYSVILANAFIVCNLALVVSGMENCGGYLAILKACVLIRNKASTALFLALPVNFGLAALEALFQFRLVKAYHLSYKLTLPMAYEGLLIAYLYSLLILIDTITTCMFYKNCKSRSRVYGEGRYYGIDLEEEEYNGIVTSSKILDELP